MNKWKVIHKDTCDQFKSKNVVQSHKLTFEEINQLYTPTKYGKDKETSHIRVLYQDTLESASNYPNSLVLNMACEYFPKDGIIVDGSTQEESLHMRSDYSLTLSRDLYPLHPNELIYSPCVHVIKDPQYRRLSQPFTVSLVACSAIRRPKLENMKYSRDDRSLMVNKIRAIFKLAALYHHPSLILGAFGCGAFGHQPDEVAEIFTEIITDFQYQFTDIVFSILGKNNYRTFHHIFTQKDLLDERA